MQDKNKQNLISTRVTRLGLSVYETAVAVVLSFTAIVSLFAFVAPVPEASAAIPKVINFQGKLTSVANGTNVPNGNYTFEFKLYSASSGGSLLWTETWDGSPSPQCDQLTVTNGVFNAKLGSCNALTGVDFTTGSLYLTVNFDDGGGFDGEMSPRKQLLSSAYAFVANGVSGDGVINTAVQSTTALSVGLSGSNPALQVDTNTASSATGLKVTSAAAAGGVALTAISSGTNENLTIDAKGSGSVTINGSATGGVVIGSGSGTFSLQTSNIDISTAGVISGATGITSSGTITFSGLGGGGTQCVQTNNTGVLSAGSCGVSSVNFNDIGDATATGTVDNTQYAQSWTWNSLAGATGLALSSSSTAAASNLQTLFSSSLTGANATSTQTTYAGLFSNAHTGTSSTNVALKLDATGGTNNIGLLIEGYAAGTDKIGVAIPNFPATSGNTAQILLGASTVPVVGDYGIYQSTSNRTNYFASPIAVNNTLYPFADGSWNLGSSSLEWGTVYADVIQSTGDTLVLDGVNTITTGDTLVFNGVTTDISTTSGEALTLAPGGTGDIILETDADTFVGIGDATPASLFTVGSGDLFQVNSSGAIAAATGITSSGTIQFSALTTNGPLYTSGGNGTLTTTAPTSGAIGYWSRSSTTLSPTTANDIVSIANTTTTGADLAVTNTGVYTGTGVFNLTANSATTGVIQQINGNALTTGQALSIASTGTGLTSGSMLRVTSATTGAVATNGIVSLNATGNYSSTSNVGLLNVTANATTAGTIQNLTGNALTTGNALRVTSTGTGLTSGSMLFVSSATTGAVATNGIVSLNATGNYSSTSNVGLLNVSANATTAGTIVNVTGNALSTGQALRVSSTSNAYSTGSLDSVSLTQSAATGTSVSGDISSIVFNPTYSTAVTTPAISGNAFDVSRSVTTNTSFASTLTLSGALARFSDSATQTTGTLTSTANAVEILQNYTSNSGAALNVTTAGSGVGLRVNDDGTLTDSTAFVVDASGNVGIGGDTTPASLLSVGNGDLFQVNSSGAIAAVVGITNTGVNTNTIQSATALTVARTGTNYAFQVDTNTASSETGVKITSAAAAGGVAIAAISSGTNEFITLDGKGSGEVRIGGVSTGSILFAGGAGSTGCTITTAGALTCDGAGTFSNFSGTNTGDVTLAAIGSSPNANGATLTGQVLNLQPADGSFGGVVSTTTQTFAGAKTFTSNVTLSKIDPSLIMLAPGSDTDFWLSVTDDGGNDDDDFFQIGDGSTPGSNAFFTINTNGNVGVGTTFSPSYDLELTGSSVAQTISLFPGDNSTFGTNATLGSIIAQSSHGGNATSAGRSAAEIRFLTGGTNYYNGQIAFWVSNTDATQFAANIEAMRINENGNVGIGTTGPDRRLDVLDASNPQLRLTYTDGSVYADFQATSGGNLELRPSSGSTVIGNYANAGTLTIAPNAANARSEISNSYDALWFTSATTVMNKTFQVTNGSVVAQALFDNAGNGYVKNSFGVGLTSPGSLLHVQQFADSTNTTTPIAFDVNSVGAAGELTASSGTQTFARIAPTINQTSTAGYTALQIYATHTAIGSGTNKLIDAIAQGTSYFSVLPTDTNVTNQPNWTSAGQVGIGASSGFTRLYHGSGSSIAFMEVGGATGTLSMDGVKITTAGQPVEWKSDGSFLHFKNASGTNTAGNITPSINADTNQSAWGFGLLTASSTSGQDILRVYNGNISTSPGSGVFAVDKDGNTRMSNALQVNGSSFAAYSRFGTSTTGHSLGAANDLLISDDFEVDGDTYLDGILRVATGSTSEAAYLTSTDTTAYSATTAQTTSRLTLFGGNGTGAHNLIRFSATSSNEAYFGTVQNASGYAEFIWKSYNGAYAERMRLDSSGNLIITDLATGGANRCVEATSTGELTLAASACGTGGGATAFNDLGDATAAGTVDNTQYAQTWTWNTLAGANGLSLTSNSTAAASNAQTLFNVALSGANATSGQTTYGAQISNTHTGTSSNNVGLQVSASGGTNNYALITNGGNVGIGDTSPSSLLTVGSGELFQVTSGGRVIQNPSNITTGGVSADYLAVSVGSTGTNDTFYGHETYVTNIQSANNSIVYGDYIEIIDGTSRPNTNIGLHTDVSTSNTSDIEISASLQGGVVLVNAGTWADSIVNIANESGTAPSTYTLANSYLHIGGTETALDGLRLISFGYVDSSAVNIPSYVGAITTDTASFEKEALVFGTRDVTTDTAASERMRIDSAGNLILQNTNFITAYGGLGTFQNHLVRSEQFDNASWTKTNVTAPTANSQTAPDGSTTAESLVSTVNGGNVSQDTSTAIGSTYTFSVWVRSSSSTQAFALRIDGTSSGTGTARAYTATTNWQRYTVTQNTSSFTGNVRVRIFPGGTGGTGTVYAWGAQLEAGSSLGNYALTTSGALTNTNRGITTESNFATTSGFTYGGRHIINLEGAISASSTLVGQLIRVNDNATGTDDTATVRALEVQGYSGSNINGINTGIASYGYTFGVHAVTTAQANEQAQPAALFADLDNGSATTQGNAIRAYTDNATSADLVSFYQESSAFSGNGLEMNFGNNSGSFSGNFIDLQKAGTSKLAVDDTGKVSINIVDADNTEAIYINTEESTAGQVVFAIESDTSNGSGADTLKFKITADGTTYNDGGSFTSPADLAEMYYVADDSQPGDVVMRVPFNSPHEGPTFGVAKYNESANLPIFGVISTDPGQVLGYDVNRPEITALQKPVALVGRVPVKVTNENGNIKAGDWITVSGSVAAHGKKAITSGNVIGQALEDYNFASGSTGTLMVFLQFGYRNIGNTIVLDAPTANGTNLQQGESVGNTASTFTIQQQEAEEGSEAVSNILQLQTGDANRFMVSSTGATSILSNLTCEEGSIECPSVLKVTQANTELMNIDARGTLTLAGTIFIKDDSFAGSVTTASDGMAEITFSYHLGTGKPVVQLTAEAQIPVFAQIVEFKQDENGNYTGFIMKTFDLQSGPIQSIVHYNVTGKQAGYITFGEVEEDIFTGEVEDGSDYFGGDGAGMVIEGGEVVGTEDESAGEVSGATEGSETTPEEITDGSEIISDNGSGAIIP